MRLPVHLRNAVALESTLIKIPFRHHLNCFLLLDAHTWIQFSFRVLGHILITEKLKVREQNTSVNIN